jgi:hypothetical protein
MLTIIGELIFRELKDERKRKKILQKPGKDVHWFPLIEYGQVL